MQRGLAGVRDASAERELSALACRIAPARCETLRLYLVDDPRPQARAYANGMLLVRSGLLRWLHSESELAYVLAHEIAHLELDHFNLAPGQAHALQHEVEADAWALQRIGAIGLDRHAPATLLQRMDSGGATRDPALQVRIVNLQGSGG